jgi:hypothetical protein
MEMPRSWPSLPQCKPAFNRYSLSVPALLIVLFFVAPAGTQAAHSILQNRIHVGEIEHRDRSIPAGIKGSSRVSLGSECGHTCELVTTFTRAGSIRTNFNSGARLPENLKHWWGMAGC